MGCTTSSSNSRARGPGPATTMLLQQADAYGPRYESSLRGLPVPEKRVATVSFGGSEPVGRLIATDGSNPRTSPHFSGAGSVHHSRTTSNGSAHSDRSHPRRGSAGGGALELYRYRSRPAVQQLPWHADAEPSAVVDAPTWPTPHRTGARQTASPAAASASTHSAAAHIVET